MSTSIEAKLRQAALSNPALVGLLGSSPFRWWDTQLFQGQQFPQVTVQEISDPKSYSVTGRLATSYLRVQFTIWGGQQDAGAQAADQVLNALQAFLDGFYADGISGRVSTPTYTVNVRRALYPQTDGPIYQRLVDVKIFNNDSL